MVKAIYVITNLIDGKRYIGQSNNPAHRFIAHLSRAKAGDPGYLYNAIRKYGKDNFVYDVIEWCSDYNDKEREYIKQYNTAHPNGYNIAPGGEEPPVHYGELHPKSVITEAQIDIIIANLKENILTESEIGRLFDPPFNHGLINSINHGSTHRRENETYPIRTQCLYNLTPREVDDIKWLLSHSLFPCHQIADYYGVNTSTIKHINSGRNYRDSAVDYPLRKHKGSKQTVPVEAILAKRSTDAIDTHLETGVCA